MKKLIVFTIFIAGFFVATPVLAEKIDSFQAAIQINADSIILVQEKILYDFEGVQRHGIFRDIPYKYQARGGNFTTKISVVSVADENGSPYVYTAGTTGRNLQIKIGDPNFLVTGIKTYVITYRVQRAINYFSDHDELYWNVTGNDWTIPISNISATVTLPQMAAVDRLQAACYAGFSGSQESCGFLTLAGQNGSGLANQFAYQQSALASGQGLTIVAGFPKGLVSQPSAWQLFLETVKDNFILFLPIAVFVLFFYLWYTRGRDPKGRGVIIAQYEAPDNLSPAEIGTIVDGSADNADISAEIINLAVKGYLKINKLKEQSWFFQKTDYELERLKPGDDSLADFQKTLLSSLFSPSKTAIKLGDVEEKLKAAGGKLPDFVKGIIEKVAPPPESKENESGNLVVKLSALRNRFYKDLKAIKDQIYGIVVSKGYFSRNPQKVKAAYVSGGAVVCFLSFWINGAIGLYAFLSILISGLIIILFGLVMPQKTKLGADTKDLILGLKEYLNVAEKDRIEFHNAPDKTPERFEKLLPYAMALKVEKAWAAQFKDLYVSEPSWYHDQTGGAFNAVIFASSLNSFSASANSTLAASPHSSAAGGGSGFGGGFSGGGFGGGGGGSW